MSYFIKKALLLAFGLGCTLYLSFQIAPRLFSATTTDKDKGPATAATYLIERDTPHLAALRASGAIRAPTAQETLTWNEGASLPYRSHLQPDFRFSVRFDYVITRAIDLPFGLRGRYAHSFLVLKGVPMPGGDPGTSCVASMDGYTINDVWRCMTKYAEFMTAAADEVRTIPARCRPESPRASVSIVGVSANAAASPAGNSRDRSNKPGDVAVHVTTPGEVMLVLSIYKPARWSITVGPKTKLAGVVLAGPKATSIEVMPEGVPVKHYDTNAIPDAGNIDLECTKAEPIWATPVEEGPKVTLFDRQVAAVLGRGLDRWVSADKLAQVQID